MDIVTLLDITKRYPNVQSVSIHKDGSMSVHLYATKKVEVVTTEPMPMIDDMPPDDVMLFASTPTFDQMVEDSKKQE